jgi:hypothetical protein
LTTTARTRYLFATITGLSLAGSLAGCAAATTTDGATSGTTSNDTYTDGDYSATGTYDTPGGTESVGVKITVASNIVTALEVTNEGVSPNAKVYQDKFASGIDAVVVGKNLNAIKVDKVAGSSLTSAGFTNALTTIKADAVAK